MKPHVRQFVSWLRLVFPPAGVALGAAATLLFLDAQCWWLMWQFGAQPPLEMLRIRDVMGLLTCFLIGATRITRFHPIFRPDYDAWLRTMPWHVGKPLPGGPVHLVLQDAFLLLLIWILMPQFTLSISYVPLCFLVGYLAAVALALYVAGVSSISYLLAFGLGLIVHVVRDPSAALAIAVLLYIPALWGLRAAWGNLWIATDLNSLEGFFKRIGKTITANAREEDEIEIAWPFDELAPRLPQYSISYRNGVLVSLLLGWWVYVLVSMWKNPVEQRTAALFATGPMMGAVVVRVIRYVNGHRPPLSLVARFVRNLGIIPRYDVIFVAPILALVIALAGQQAVLAQIVPPAVTMGGTTALVFIIVLTMGPSLARWHFTGGHRRSTGLRNAERFEKI